MYKTGSYARGAGVCDGRVAKPEGSDGCEVAVEKCEASGLDRGTNPDDEVGMLYRGPREGGGCDPYVEGEPVSYCDW